MNSKINFKKINGLVPVIIQDYKTRQVLMLGFMNKKAYNKTIKTNLVTFWSRSRKKIWIKGETLGNYLKVKNIKIDCDNDTLLIQVKPEGPVCHTGSKTCFRKLC
jgi:phosphoribosyl-ATP pyrophosphohydrolase/phosphoribosyl-AMP cyclohydrolase